ncbi:MAG: regulatory protein GemA [Deltaproteobacteria bacterium]|nr:regulatory protein GemA [Deltaproteobacteria bacterium]
MKKLITNEQIKCIKTVQRRHQTDDDYREMLEKRFRVTSCTQLTCAQGTVLIKLYRSWGWTNFPRKGRRSVGSKQKAVGSLPRRSGNMTRMVSPAQIKKIGALASMIEWRVKDGLTQWVSKRFSIDRIRTAQQAWQVIEGLKKMFERQMEKEHGPGWRDLDYTDVGIRRYIEG